MLMTAWAGESSSTMSGLSDETSMTAPAGRIPSSETGSDKFTPRPSVGTGIFPVVEDTSVAESFKATVVTPAVVTLTNVALLV
jgi:hypothetical protein